MSEGNGHDNAPPISSVAPPAAAVVAPFVTVRMTASGVELDTNIRHPLAVSAALYQGLAAVMLQMSQPPPPTIHKPNGVLRNPFQRSRH